MTQFIIDQDDLNEMLVLHDIARQMSMAFDRRADHLDLTRAQWKLLSILRRNPGIRQAQVAAILEIEPITLVRQLDRMEATGWVERRPDPNDRRANQLYLTDKIAGVVTQMRALGVNLRRDALAGFTEVEHRAFLDYLKRIKRNVGQILATKEEES